MVTELKLQWCKIVQKTKEAYLKFPVPLRKKVWKNNYLFQKGCIVPIDEFDNEQKVAEYTWRNFGSGTWYIFGRSKGKTKTHNKPVKLCKVIIHDLGKEEYSYEISQTWRLKQRYKWFWKGK